jgi:hypothetical protein
MYVYFKPFFKSLIVDYASGMANDMADQVGLQVSLLQQLRVTAAEPGRVEFELDIQKEHTVGCADTVRFSSP